MRISLEDVGTAIFSLISVLFETQVCVFGIMTKLEEVTALGAEKAGRFGGTILDHHTATAPEMT
jgi:hypothetical protein